MADLGKFHCSCCCGDLREYTDDGCNIGYMRCTGCRCTRVRVGDATQILLRIQVAGSPTIAHMEQAAELARMLGAPDDISLQRDGSSVHYFEMHGNAALNQLEISKLRGRPAN